MHIEQIQSLNLEFNKPAYIDLGAICEPKVVGLLGRVKSESLYCRRNVNLLCNNK